MRRTVHFTNPFSSISVVVLFVVAVEDDCGRSCTLVGAILVLDAITLPSVVCTYLW